MAIALLFLVLLATGAGRSLVGTSADLPYHLGLIPIALLFVAIFFAAFTYGRRKQVAELKDLLTRPPAKASHSPKINSISSDSSSPSRSAASKN